MNKAEETKWEDLIFVAEASVRTTLPYKKGAIIHTTSTSVTMGTKDLRAILLKTGGSFTRILNGCVTPFEIRKRSLGLGVYNVWTESNFIAE